MIKTYQSIPIDNLLYSCTSEVQRSTEKFLGIHAISCILEGELHITTTKGITVLNAGSIGLVERNQLIRSIKLPKSGGEFKAINIFLDVDILRKYSIENNIQSEGNRHERDVYKLPNDAFIKAFFESIQPYFSQPQRMGPSMAELKTFEVIELMLNASSYLKDILFDFSQLGKIDLEAFMLQHYMFNVPIDTLAKLTGRSRTGFKRDFQKVLGSTPYQWLKLKRLQQAYYLIKNKSIKPSAAYLEVGFENLSHFSLAFKQQFGINPSALSNVKEDNVK